MFLHAVFKLGALCFLPPFFTYIKIHSCLNCDNKPVNKKQNLYTCVSGFTERASMAQSASANESLTDDTLSSKAYGMLSIK
jgi:hypothetical protein